ncbi:MAG: sulfate transporter [Gammaproteobacteria bacterium]|jgi:phospholipid transport system transporter-binding protein|nr:MAG: sulfate transporter [Gammaproteobacteria bacterium]PHR83429.1 MAG: sulfate transporter [Colwellia sp.]
MAKITLNITTTAVEFSGELTRHSIMQITKKSIKELLLPPSITLDLAEITRIDTAGLAWLFYLLEQASIANCQLFFVNIPTKLDKLIRLSGVEGFLPVKQ